MQTGRLVPWQAPVYEFLTSVNVAIPPSPPSHKVLQKGIKL